MSQRAHDLAQMQGKRITGIEICAGKTITFKTDDHVGMTFVCSDISGFTSISAEVHSVTGVNAVIGQQIKSVEHVSGLTDAEGNLTANFTLITEEDDKLELFLQGSEDDFPTLFRNDNLELGGAISQPLLEDYVSQ